MTIRQIDVMEGLINVLRQIGHTEFDATMRCQHAGRCVYSKDDLPLEWTPVLDELEKARFCVSRAAGLIPTLEPKLIDTPAESKYD